MKLVVKCIVVLFVLGLAINIFRYLAELALPATREGRLTALLLPAVLLFAGLLFALRASYKKQQKQDV